MRHLGMTVLMIFLTTALASAATVDLTDGRSVQGDIVKQDNQSLEINVDGVTMTYYADEIKDIDGQPFTPSTTAPAQQPAPPVAGPAAPADQVSAQPEMTAQPETPSPLTDTVDPVKKALILKFIEVFGTRQALNNNFELMLKQIAQSKPDEAQKIRERVKMDDLIERLVPVYDRHFTTEDLEAFIAFYGSPEGQKLISTIPTLMKESIQESIKYMAEKFPEVKSGQ